MSSFAGNLKGLMKERRLTAKAVSDATGIAQSTLSEWANGREPKLTEAVVRLATYLGVTVEYLVTGKDATRKDAGQDAIGEFLGSAVDGFTTIHTGVYRLRIEKLVSSGKKGGGSDEG